MMVVNGMLIGVIGAATWQAGMALQLWSFVAPHGVLELRRSSSPAAPGWKSREGCSFPVCFRGANLWRGQAGARRA